MTLSERQSPSVAGYLERRIQSTLATQTPPRVDTGSIRPDNIILSGVPVREMPVFMEIETKEPVMQALVGDAVLAAADATVGLEPIPQTMTKKDPEMLARKDLIDNAAGNSMKDSAANFDFGVEAHGEGGRDIRDNGQNVVLVEGDLGKGDVQYVLATDAIDNTDAAAWGTERSISVAVLAPKDGLMTVADEYWQKLVIPDSVGDASITDSPDDVFDAVLKDADFATEEENGKLIVTVLDREENREIMEAAQSRGITVKRVNGGDVLPVVTAGKQPDGTVQMLYTRGGGPELALAAGIARAKGDLKLEARRWYKDPGLLAQSEVLNLDDIAPSEDMIAVIAHLTDDPDYTGQKGIPIYAKTPNPQDQKVGITTIVRGEVKLSSYQR